MPDFEDIRRGLAANLTALDDYQISPYLLDNPAGKTIQVAGAKEADYPTFGDDDAEYVIVVEACLVKSSDVGPQKLLDQLLAPSGATSLKAAVESDVHLTSRLADDGTKTSGHPAACGGLALARFAGQAGFTLPRGGVEVLLASWEIKVIA